MSHSIIELPAVAYEVNRPDPRGTADVFSRIGYSLDDALADLVDNCVDAGATKVLIRFFRTHKGLQRVVIADDGRGMSEQELCRAMQYGARTQHESTDLGKYGIGLKAASFSQCRSLSVVTRQAGIASGRRWTLASIEMDWRQEVISPVHADQILDQDWGTLDLSESGTLVIWDQVDFIAQSLARGDVNVAVQGMMRTVPVGLGMRFHRFIDQGRISISVDVVNTATGVRPIPVQAVGLDPFGYPVSGKPGFPTDFRLAPGDGESLTLTAHIWPAKSKHPNFKLGGGKVAARQGFYFYRNDRLIQAGGWNGLQNDSEPHLSLARVSIDLPPALDSAFRLSVQKSKIEPPSSFLLALQDVVSGTTTFRNYLSVADAVYRDGGRPKRESRVVPKTGFPAGLARVARRTLAPQGPVTEVGFAWRKLSGNEVFELDRDSGVIVLNQRYRKAILGGARPTATDAPVFKSMLFMLLEELLSRERFSKRDHDRLQRLNSLLTSALKESDG